MPGSTPHQALVGADQTVRERCAVSAKKNLNVATSSFSYVGDTPRDGTATLVAAAANSALAATETLYFLMGVSGKLDLRHLNELIT